MARLQSVPHSRRRVSVGAIAWRVGLAAILVLTFYPFVFMIMTSLKDTHQFYHSFWLPS